MKTKDTNQIYREKFKRIHSITFKRMAEDKDIALKYAKIGLEKTGNINPSQETIEEHAEIIQVVAKIMLTERMNKKKKKKSKKKH